MPLFPRPRDAARVLLVALATASLAPLTAHAQEASPVTIHGFLSQGYAQGNKSSLFGIDSVATTDYRSAAVQIRYAIGEKDNFLVQFAHRSLGKSLLNDVQSEVALDWIFYQRQLLGATVKVGRVPIPRGIYNETRDVGTIIPFYRAPYNFYTEGMETVDGASLKYTHRLGAGFALEGAAFGGGFDFRQLAFSTSTGDLYVTESRAERGLGATTWLHTPLTGVRVGVNGMRYRFDRFQVLSGVNGQREEDGTMWGLSLDATRERYFVRGEYQEFKVNDGQFSYPSWYAQAGARVLPRTWVNAQMDAANVRQDIRIPTSPTTSVVIRRGYDYARDNAVGLNFMVSPNFVLKAEMHEAKGFNYDRFVNPFTSDAVESRYGIVSAAVSF